MSAPEPHVSAQVRAVIGPAYVGLTGREAAVLDALVRLGESTVAALASRTAVSPESLAQALERLVALDYALKIDGSGAPADAESRYRAVAQVNTP